jgi:predicted regulator of Ras-like GTPase activity (Roadblock/LC7/MglB family)
MDASAALERLRDISSQVRAAVIFDRSGEVVGSTLGDDERAKRFAEEAASLLESAEKRRQEDAPAEFAQLEVALREGSVFLVRHDDRLIAAVTSPEPTVGLVFYDLKSCLRDLEEPAADEAAEPAEQAPRARKRSTTTRKTTTRKAKSDAES